MSLRLQPDPSSHQLCSFHTCGPFHYQSVLLPKFLTSVHRQEINAMSPLVENQFRQRIFLPTCPPIWCLSLFLPTYLSISIQIHGHHNVHPISPTRIAHLTFHICEHLFLSNLWHHISPTISHTTQHFLNLILLVFQHFSLFLQDCSIHLGTEPLSIFPTKNHLQHSSQISPHLVPYIQSSHFSPTKSLSIQWNHHGSVLPFLPSGTGAHSLQCLLHSPCTKCSRLHLFQTP